MDKERIEKYLKHEQLYKDEHIWIILKSKNKPNIDISSKSFRTILKLLMTKDMDLLTNLFDHLINFRAPKTIAIKLKQSNKDSYTNEQKVRRALAKTPEARVHLEKKNFIIDCNSIKRIAGLSLWNKSFCSAIVINHSHLNIRIVTKTTPVKFIKSPSNRSSNKTLNNSAVKDLNLEFNKTHFKNKAMICFNLGVEKYKIDDKDVKVTHIFTESFDFKELVRDKLLTGFGSRGFKIAIPNSEGGNTFYTPSKWLYKDNMMSLKSHEKEIVIKDAAFSHSEGIFNIKGLNRYSYIAISHGFCIGSGMVDPKQILTNHEPEICVTQIDFKELKKDNCQHLPLTKLQDRTDLIYPITKVITSLTTNSSEVFNFRDINRDIPLTIIQNNEIFKQINYSPLIIECTSSTNTFKELNLDRLMCLRIPNVFGTLKESQVDILTKPMKKIYYSELKSDNHIHFSLKEFNNGRLKQDIDNMNVEIKSCKYTFLTSNELVKDISLPLKLFSVMEKYKYYQWERPVNIAIYSNVAFEFRELKKDTYKLLNFHEFNSPFKQVDPYISSLNPLNQNDFSYKELKRDAHKFLTFDGFNVTISKAEKRILKISGCIPNVQFKEICKDSVLISKYFKGFGGFKHDPKTTELHIYTRSIKSIYFQEMLKIKYKYFPSPNVANCKSTEGITHLLSRECLNFQIKDLEKDRYKISNLKFFELFEYNLTERHVDILTNPINFDYQKINKDINKPLSLSNYNIEISKLHTQNISIGESTLNNMLVLKIEKAYLIPLRFKITINHTNHKLFSVELNISSTCKSISFEELTRDTNQTLKPKAFKRTLVKGKYILLFATLLENYKTEFEIFSHFQSILTEKLLHYKQRANQFNKFSTYHNKLVIPFLKNIENELLTIKNLVFKFVDERIKLKQLKRRTIRQKIQQLNCHGGEKYSDVSEHINSGLTKASSYEPKFVSDFKIQGVPKIHYESGVMDLITQEEALKHEVATLDEKIAKFKHAKEQMTQELKELKEKNNSNFKKIIILLGFLVIALLIYNILDIK
jgi:hypothetical protein